jgi:signal transduction histidine kinase
VLGRGFIVTEKRNAIMATQQKKVLAGKLFLEQIFESSFEDLAIMANSKLFIAACTAMDNDNEMKEYVKDLISNIFNNKSHYFQFRFIDSTGMEKCRAERINGEPVFRQKDQLQNKADRYYFKEAIKLNEGESYISPFDLNIEHGEIEVPYRPMIRICSPVFDDTGKKIGVNVLNFDGRKVIHGFKMRVGIFPGDAYLVNDAGYFLVAPDEKTEWGFMFPGKKDNDIAHAFYDAHQKLDSIKTGQFLAKTGLYTVVTVDPLAYIGKFVKESVYPKKYQWKLITFMPAGDLAVFSILPVSKLLLILLLVLSGSFFFGWLYTNIWFKKYGTQLQLLESERKLKKANDAKNRFFSIISHDLKNSSVGIATFMGVLIDNFKEFSDEERLSYLNELNAAAVQHNKLLVEILEWARLQQEAVKFEPANQSVSAIFQEQVDTAALSLKNKDLQVEMLVDEELEVYADREMLKTVIRNLLNNAIKFSNPGGKIVLSGKRRAEFVELKVTDQGIGIEEDNIQKLFKLDSTFFRKGTQQEEGSGFGLKLVAGLVAKNNGRIYVESEVGQGSSFVISFPSGK